MVLNFYGFFFCLLSSECRTTESITNSAMLCIECFIGPSSHLLGLLGNRTIRHRNIDIDQCKLLSHWHLLKIFNFFYLKCTSVRNITGGSIFFITSHQLYKITSSLLGHFQYCGPLWIITFTCAYSSNN